jgi:hypothetical protein
VVGIADTGFRELREVHHATAPNECAVIVHEQGGDGRVLIECGAEGPGAFGARRAEAEVDAIRRGFTVGHPDQYPGLADIGQNADPRVSALDIQDDDAVDEVALRDPRDAVSAFLLRDQQHVVSEAARRLGDNEDILHRRWGELLSTGDRRSRSLSRTDRGST